MDFQEDLPEELVGYFSHQIADAIDIRKHRWYETSISVYHTNLGLIGVRSITNTFSESSEVEEMCHTLIFFEMKPIRTTAYIIKK